ncbi:MAG: hypothetical protein KBD76_03615 [Bacteriovorax sp.]|nr:hypothetical protein [Bacteriovorax sp.]
MYFIKLLFLFSLICIPSTYASWIKEAELFSPRWRWEGDSSSILIKKRSSLKEGVLDLDQFVMEIYETKKADLALFNISDWKMLKKEKLNIPLKNILLTTGSYLSQKKEMIYWSEVFYQTKDNLIQCLVSSSQELTTDQINKGIQICQE